ncbi:MAG TPA: hypothetical protein VGC79_00105, partial [Polyangiaceae bacterium]
MRITGATVFTASPSGEKRKMRTEKLSILALGFCSITAVVGCGDQNSGTNAPASASEESSGEVNLALQLANGTTLNSATYTIVGPNAYS